MRTATTRTITGRVNSDGTIAAAGSGGFTAQRTSAGAYAITVAPGLRLVGAAVTSTWSAAYAAVIVDTFTDRSFRVLMATSAGVATDMSFALTATVAA